MQDDPRADFIRKMVTEGISEDQMVDALKVYDSQQAPSLGHETGKGLIEFGKTLWGNVEGLPSMMRMAAGAPNKEDLGTFMGVGQALTHPKEAGQSILADQTIGRSGLSTGEHIGHSAANLLTFFGPGLAGKTLRLGKSARAAALAMRLAEEQATLRTSRGLKEASLIRDPSLARPPNRPPTGQSVIEGTIGKLAEPTKAPGVQLPPPPFSLGARAAPEQPRISVQRVPALPESAGAEPAAPPPSGPPLGGRLVSPPATDPNPLATHLKAQETAATRPTSVELPPDLPQPAVSYPTKGEIKRLLGAKKAGKGKSPGARKTEPGTPPPATPPPTPPKSLVQKLEEALTDQRGEIDLTGKTGIPPEGGGKLVPAGGEPSGTPTMPTPAEIAGGEADAFLSDWAKGGKLRATLLNQKLTPEVRSAIETKLGERPGELPELRKALGLSDTLEKAAAPHPAPLGFQSSPTISLEEQVAKKGLKQTALDAGMKEWELKARLDAKGDPVKLAELMQKAEGTDATNRALGTKLESKGTLPENAMLRTKASIERSKAAGEPISAKDKAFADRWHKENPDSPTLYSGIDPRFLWGMAKRHPVLAGGATGLALGAAANAGSKDPTEALGNVALDTAGGAALGGLLGKFGGRALWTEQMLSGGAPMKNLGQSVGTPFIAALENIRAPQKLAKNPIAESLRLPTNAKRFWELMKKPDVRHRNPDLIDQANLPATRVIGALDGQLRSQLQREGHTPYEVHRHMLTEPQSFSNAMGNTGTINNALSRFIFRFPTIPTNIVRGGFQETAQMLGLPAVEPPMPHVNPMMRRAVTAGSVLAGGEVGQHYVQKGRNAQDKLRRAMLVSILSSTLGRRTLPFSISASFPWQKYTGIPLGGAGWNTAIGSLSPAPELAFHPESLFKAPYSGAVKFWKRLVGAPVDPKKSY